MSPFELESTISRLTNGPLSGELELTSTELTADYLTSTYFPTSSTSMTPDEQKAYDALTPEQQADFDAAARQKEVEEQATLPYKWTQDLSTVTLTLDVPTGSRARDLAVEIKRTSIKVKPRRRHGEYVV